MSKIEEIGKDIVAYTCTKLNDNNIPVDEPTILKITLAILENFKQNLEFSKKQNKNFEKVIKFLKPYYENSKA